MTEQTEAPAGLRTPRWGFGDVVVTLLGALVIGNILALLLLPPTTPDHPVPGYAWQTLLVLVGPWVALAGWPLLATRTRGNGPVRDLALRHKIDMPITESVYQVCYRHLPPTQMIGYLMNRPHTPE